MKLLLLSLTIFAIYSCGPGNTQLKLELDDLKARVDSLEQKRNSDEMLSLAAPANVKSTKKKTTKTNPAVYSSYSAPKKVKSSSSNRSSSDSWRCQATTQKGTQCKRSAASGSSYCWQH